MSFNENKETVAQRIFNRANRAYRVASRIQYTLLSSNVINYDEDEVGERLEELNDSLHQATLELENVIEILKEIED